MGHPKALLVYHGETFLNGLVKRLGEVCGKVIVVVGHHAQEIGDGLREPAQLVVNPDPDRGQLSSLQTGLTAAFGAQGFAFLPVDCPAVESQTLVQLSEAFAQREPSIEMVIPRFEGQRGHPVFLTEGVAQELLALPATASAKEVTRNKIAQTLYVDVKDAGVLSDVDDPASYRRLLETQV